MKFQNYKEYMSAETMMGPNSVRILEELLAKYPLRLSPQDTVLDLGCGKGLTSLVLARETGAAVVADDLWIKPEDNQKRFETWGIAEQVTAVCGDAHDLPFERAQFRALVSVDSYHYYAGTAGFFEDKILPFLEDGAEVLIGIPGIQEKFAGQSEALLSPWLGDEAYMFKSPGEWKALLGGCDRIEAVDTWEMNCFECAWKEWFETENEFAGGDLAFYDKLIKPYTCFVGIRIKIK